MDMIAERGFVSTMCYFCPNTVLHGYMATMLDRVNPNHSKSTGLIEGSVIAHNITRVMNAGVSFDKITPTTGGFEIDGLGKKEKLSSMALGHIPIGTSHYLTSDDVRLNLRINYKGIRRLPVADAVRTMLCDLANFQVGSFLSEEIEARRDTTLFPADDVYYEDVDILQEKLIESLNICRKAGYISGGNTEFLVELKDK